MRITWAITELSERLFLNVRTSVFGRMGRRVASLPGNYVLPEKPLFQKFV
jgi:hypothetical protein